MSTRSEHLVAPSAAPARAPGGVPARGAVPADVVEARAALARLRVALQDTRAQLDELARAVDAAGARRG